MVASYRGRFPQGTEPPSPTRLLDGTTQGCQQLLYLRWERFRPPSRSQPTLQPRRQGCLQPRIGQQFGQGVLDRIAYDVEGPCLTDDLTGFLLQFRPLGLELVIAERPHLGQPLHDPVADAPRFLD